MNITYQILKEHLVSGELKAGNKITIRIDQTLTQDSTGTMAYLQLEKMGISKVKTDLSVAYCDHQTLQNGFENADDHLYIQSVANKYGVLFSKVGNGICHQVHLERFAKPGVTLLGSDSHTPNAGGIGALAIGAGGLDVACAMAGRPFTLVVPSVIKVELKGKLRKGVSAKDVILKLLSILSVKGNVNKAIEYSGDGLAYLDVTERATITNMGAELGVTTSIFPSDEKTLEFLKSQKRAEDFKELKASLDAEYERVIEIDLATLEPLAACPSMPDNVKPVSELVDVVVNQVIVGSCTNSSYLDIMKVVNILKDKKVHPDVSFSVACGSKNVLTMLSANGGLQVLLDAGARVLECACGPCIGMGMSPNSKGVSIRTFNRNFEGRSQTADALVYLVSPEVAALTAINGHLTSSLGVDFKDVVLPEYAHINDSLIVKPNFEDKIVRGPNIKELTSNTSVTLPITSKVLLKLTDNITTDHILPGGAKVLPYRSNIEKISEFTFMQVDTDFVNRAKNNGNGVIIAGENYGQGSSREHAAMVVKYLGIDVVIAKSFARIHLANLINSGVLPLEFVSASDYDKLEEGSDIVIDEAFILNNTIKLRTPISADELEIVKVGGLLNRIKKENRE